jgi:hypothetical protein
MKSGKTKIVGACAFAVLAIGLSLAAAYLTPASSQPRVDQWCVNIGGANNCYPTLAACEAANPGRTCVKGPS